MKLFQSSFSYRNVFHGNTVMVIVPHEDDEVNTAGATIAGAREEGLRVIVVFLTNGAGKYSATTRAREAVESCNVLGVKEEDIVFLGYPDGRNLKPHSIFKAMTLPDPPFHETHSGKEYQDFSFETFGIHHACTWENLLNDLEAVIEKNRPDALIATDFDSHRDHRMCSIAFDMVMGSILRRTEDYLPIILKGFAYSPAFHGKTDFFLSPLPSSYFNEEGNTIFDSGTTSPAHRWEERIRFPVPASCRTMDTKENKIFCAMSCYISQIALRYAERVANSDQIFWIRRSDNITLQADIAVSSGNATYLQDFLHFDMSADGSEPIFCDYLWQPDENDEKRTFCMKWNLPRDISFLRFYGAVEKERRSLIGTLTFSTGYRCTVEMTEESMVTDITVPLQNGVKWICFEVKSCVAGAGIGEVEVYEKADYDINILQPLCGEDFIYEWDSSTMNGQDFGIYNTTRKEVNFIFDGKEVTEDIVRNKLSGSSDMHRLQLEVTGGNVEIPIRSSKASLRTIHRKRLWLSYEWWKIKLAIFHGIIRKKLLFGEE